MAADTESHVLYRVANAPLRRYPFPHIYVENVLPDEVYRQVLADWPSELALTPITDTGRAHGEAYKKRRILDLDSKGLARLSGRPAEFWTAIAAWLLGPEFRHKLFGRFDQFVRARFAGVGTLRVGHEVMLVEDATDYSLGPHTDSPTKVISVLFYLPDDDSKPHLGTSIYIPRDPSFTCPGGPHHSFADFKLVATMPYVRNAMFAFVKSDTSFHGVEPVRGGDRRRLIQYDIRSRPPGAALPRAENGSQPAASRSEPSQAVERRS